MIFTRAGDGIEQILGDWPVGSVPGRAVRQLRYGLTGIGSEMFSE